MGGGRSAETQLLRHRSNATGNNKTETLFRDAVTRHGAGDLDGAEESYRKILEVESDFIPALHSLGRICGAREKLCEAGKLLERAHSLSPNDVDILADLAHVRRLEGHSADARRLIEKAIDLEPEHAALHYALSGLHLKSGDIASAIVCLERTVALDQSFAGAQNDLGAAYLELGINEKARCALESAVRCSPSLPAPYRNLATLFFRLGDSTSAAQCLRQALDQAPGDHDLRKQLAQALFQSGSAVAALEQYLILAKSNPDDATLWTRMAETASKLDRRTDAITWYRRALECDPRQPEVLNNLGILLSENGCYEEAAQIIEEAVRIQPEFAHGFHNLAGTYHVQGRFEEAVDAYKRALDLDPHNTLTISNFIAITNYRSQDKNHLIEALHARFLQSVAPERTRVYVRQEKDSTVRRLRMGYLSPDFRQHSVAFFIEPLIESHDRRHFEIYCYSDVARPDTVTERLKGHADHWRDVSTDSDETLATRVRQDRIDLLVDLGGHFAGNRLSVFAQKPAPVQIAYLGYPATTGLPEVDYRLTDRLADPPGEADAAYSEKLIRLPGTFLCYRPPDTAPQLPGISKGHGSPITFGSFNELPKISPEIISLWCRILNQVSGSTLLLKATALADPATSARLERRFEAAGVTSNRLELLSRTATLEEHLALYARVDVALDTYPYNGTTTTCEALYMGVPVVTLSGKAHAGRVGVSLLSVVDFPELVAGSDEEYVRKAVELAANEEARRTYRMSLRDRLRESPLCDARTFTKVLENSYQECWKLWLESEHRDRKQKVRPRKVAGAVEIETRDGSRMALPDDLNQLTTYVMLEQEDWFEDETGFLRRFLSSGMRVLDVGANFGVYTVIAARCVGENGRVFSVEPSSTTARWLRANVALNEVSGVEILQLALSDRGGEVKLSVQSGAECNRLVSDAAQFERTELVKVLRLDDCARQHGMASLDFMKLDAEGAEKQIMDGGRRFLAEESPLVMFEIKSAEDFDLSLVRKFSRLGYQPFRLIPGLELLAPVDLTEPLDAFALNLFALKSDRQKALADRGLLATDAAGSPIVHQGNDGEVWDYFRSRLYSKSHLDSWKSRIQSMTTDAGTRWMRILGYYVAAANVASPPSSRLASLKAAFTFVADSVPDVDPAARLNSLARIAWALGYRYRALGALQELIDMGGDGAGAFDWPFLPASPHFDAIDPCDRLAEWCDACVRDQFECLRTYSSYFLGEHDSASLEKLKGSEFQRPEMERRRLLVRLRQGLPLVDTSPAVRLKSPENNNPEFWLSGLKRSRAEVAGKTRSAR